MHINAGATEARGVGVPGPGVPGHCEPRDVDAIAHAL